MKTATKKTVYRYRMESTGDSSAKYGPCEVCGKHCTEIFHQVEERRYGNEWTQAGCNNDFGHADCLKAKRR